RRRLCGPQQQGDRSRPGIRLAERRGGGDGTGRGGQHHLQQGNRGQRRPGTHSAGENRGVPSPVRQSVRGRFPGDGGRCDRSPGNPQKAEGRTGNAADKAGKPPAEKAREHSAVRGEILGKKRSSPIAVYRIGAASSGRGSGRISGSGAAARRVYLHGAYWVTFVRGRRDRPPWREAGRRQLFAQRDHTKGRWTGNAGGDRLNSCGFVRDPWRKPVSPFSPPGNDGGRRPAAGKSTKSREERAIDQPGSSVERVSGVGADG